MFIDAMRSVRLEPGSFLRIKKLHNFPEGDMSSSPGLLYSATQGKRPAPQPQRGCVRLRIETGDGVGGVACRNPVGARVVDRGLPKVAEVQQPWASGRNHFVLEALL